MIFKSQMFVTIVWLCGNIGVAVVPGVGQVTFWESSSLSVALHLLLRASCG